MPSAPAGTARALVRTLRDYLRVKTGYHHADVLRSTWNPLAGSMRTELEAPRFGLFGMPRHRLSAWTNQVEDLAAAQKTLADDLWSRISEKFSAVEEHNMRFTLTLPELVTFGEVPTLEIRLRDTIGNAVRKLTDSLDNRGTLIGSILAAEYTFRAIQWPRAARGARQRALEENVAVESVLRRFERDIQVLEELAMGEPVSGLALIRTVRTANEFLERTPPKLRVEFIRDESEALALLAEPNVRVEILGSDIIPRLAQLVKPQLPEVPRRLEDLVGRIALRP